ncbi:MAG: GntR family transcriptional regulator [Candidatus Dormiibacterota bacterium]
MIHFRLNAQSGVATYVQLVQQVRHALRSGLLTPGDQLPTVKEVVGSLAINPNTVLKAYRELEHAGLVEGRPGMGTFVLRSLDGPPPDKQAALRKSLQRWLQSAFGAGLGPDAVLAFVDAAIRDVTEDRVA